MIVLQTAENRTGHTDKTLFTAAGSTVLYRDSFCPATSISGKNTLFIYRLS